MDYHIYLQVYFLELVWMQAVIQDLRSGLSSQRLRWAMLSFNKLTIFEELLTLQCKSSWASSKAVFLRPFFLDL